MMQTNGLDRRARELCDAFGGRWSRGKGMCRCPAHDDRTPSLGLKLGQRAILVHCFAGCASGDVLAAFARHGVPTRSLFDGSREKIEIVARSDAPDANAVRLWPAAAPLTGSPGATYLQSRAIDVASSELRFLARTPFGPRGRTRWLPALLAAVSTDAGPIAIQRTFLTPRGTIAPMTRPKRGLGAFGIGAVRLHAPVEGLLGLAEGLESALSAHALHNLPCWATLGNARFGIVAIPDSVTELHLFLDGDAGGDVAETRSFEAYARPGRTIVPHRPPAPFTDWNDVLRARTFGATHPSSRGEAAIA
jgi:putative DNA primase/helicase